jgi:hypothetical protein
MGLLLGAVLTALVSAIATADPTHLGDGDRLSWFAGAWKCEGVFPSTGERLSASMRFERDLQGAVLVKHHDDAAAPFYRALETWAYSAEDKRYNAAVADNFGGVRDFTSLGWEGDTLSWTSAPSVQQRQQFVYVKSDPNTFRVDWRVAVKGKGYAVGDTLTCRREHPAAASVADAGSQAAPG